jgi:predicted ArsR family transcriptional regulator
MARTPQPSGTYARITSRLYGSLAQTEPPSSPLTGLLLARIADAIFEACESAVTTARPSQRLTQTLAALASEGLAFEAAKSHGSVELRRLDCRWSRLVGESPEAIEQERRLLSALLGLDAVQIEHDGVKFVYRLSQTAMQS